MVQSPSWEANWFSASQEIPRISRNPKVFYRTHKRPPPVSILGQPNLVHIPTSHLLEIHPNIIHPSTPWLHIGRYIGLFIWLEGTGWLKWLLGVCGFVKGNFSITWAVVKFEVKPASRGSWCRYMHCPRSPYLQLLSCSGLEIYIRGFEVLTVVCMKAQVFWGVTPFKLINSYWSFECL